MFIFSLLYKQKCVYLHYQSKRKVYNGKDKQLILKNKRLWQHSVKKT